MAKTQLVPPPNLEQQLQEARKEANRLLEASNVLKAKFDQAVAAERFADAESLKAELSPAHTAAVMAEAHLRGLRDVASQLAAEHAERVRAAEIEAQLEAARVTLDAALEAEKTAMGEVHAHWNDALAGIDAVRESLRAAVEAEQGVYIARSEAMSCQVLLGQREAGTRVARANFASAHIAQSQALDAIFRGLSL
jgi:hypothetical protein